MRCIPGDDRFACGAMSSSQRLGRINGARVSEKPHVGEGCPCDSARRMTVDVDTAIELLHQRCIDPAREARKDVAQDRESFERIGVHKRRGLVEREEAEVVLQQRQPEIGDLAIGGIALDDVERAIEQLVVKLQLLLGSKGLDAASCRGGAGHPAAQLDVRAGWPPSLTDFPEEADDLQEQDD